MSDERTREPQPEAEPPTARDAPSRDDGAMSDDDLDAVSGGSGPALGKPGCIYPPRDR